MQLSKTPPLINALSFEQSVLAGNALSRTVVATRADASKAVKHATQGFADIVVWAGIGAVGSGIVGAAT